MPGTIGSKCKTPRNHPTSLRPTGYRSGSNGLLHDISYGCRFRQSGGHFEARRVGNKLHQHFVTAAPTHDIQSFYGSPRATLQAFQYGTVLHGKRFEDTTDKFSRRGRFRLIGFAAEPDNRCTHRWGIFEKRVIYVYKTSESGTRCAQFRKPIVRNDCSEFFPFGHQSLQQPQSRDVAQKQDPVRHTSFVGKVAGHSRSCQYRFV